MSILRNRTQSNYTVISQCITRDTSLGCMERGVLLTILSLPDNWEFSIEGLCRILPDGKTKISNSIKKLVDKGYLKKYQDKNSNGRFSRNIIEVFESPQIAAVVKDDTEKKESNQRVTKPLAENQSTAKPVTEVIAQSNNNILNTKQDNTNHHLSESELYKMIDQITDDDGIILSKQQKTMLLGQVSAYSETISNYPAYIRQCLKNMTSKPSKMQLRPVFTQFHHANQNCYDFEKLEKRLLEN